MYKRQELTLTALKPLLSVQVTKEVTVEETIAYATQTEETAALPVSYTHLLVSFLPQRIFVFGKTKRATVSIGF